MKMLNSFKKWEWNRKKRNNGITRIMYSTWATANETINIRDITTWRPTLTIVKISPTLAQLTRRYRCFWSEKACVAKRAAGTYPSLTESRWAKNWALGCWTTFQVGRWSGKWVDKLIIVTWWTRSTLAIGCLRRANDFNFVLAANSYLLTLCVLENGTMWNFKCIITASCAIQANCVRCCSAFSCHVCQSVLACWAIETFSICCWCTRDELKFVWVAYTTRISACPIWCGCTRILFKRVKRAYAAILAASIRGGCCTDIFERCAKGTLSDICAN